MAEAAIERMREYAEHDAECQGQPGYDIPCSCGYDELMKELDDANWEGSMHTDYSHYWPVNWRPQDERILATMGADVPRIHADVGASPDNLREIHLPLTNRVEMHR